MVNISSIMIHILSIYASVAVLDFLLYIHIVGLCFLLYIITIMETETTLPTEAADVSATAGVAESA